MINAQFVFGTPFWPFICPLISCHNFDRWLNPIFFLEWSWCLKFASGSIDFECWSSIWWLLKYAHWIKSSSILREEKKGIGSSARGPFYFWSNAHENHLFEYIGIQITLGTEWMPNIMHPISIINLFDKQLICLCRRCAWTTRERKKTVSSIPRWWRCNAGCLSICHIKSKLNTAVRRSY